MGIAPWGALGGGAFKTEEQRRSQDGRKVEATDAQIKISQVLEKIANRKETIITSIAQAYVMQKAPYVFPIIGGRNVDHLRGNIEALSIALSPEDIKEIEAAVPFDLGFPHNFVWGEKVPATNTQVWLVGMGGTQDYVSEPQASSHRL